MEISNRIKAAIRDIPDYPRPGILFKDITPVLADPVLVRDIIKEMARVLVDQKIDAIAAVEARGFIFGSILAHELQCGFIPVRKSGKLPYKKLVQTYDLEYGSAAIEMHVDAVRPGSRIVVHDDLLATGGTAVAAAELIEKLQGVVAGFSFLVNLGFLPGEKNLTERFGITPQYLVRY